MMSSGFNIWIQTLTKLDYILFFALGVFFVMQMYYYIRYGAAVNRWFRHRRSKSQQANSQELNFPGVSVIVCARNEAENLENYLQTLLTQDYPLFEVIVVNDGSEDSTQDVIDRYMLSDSRIRTTFVPLDARVGSTKKLGLTLAAKSAKYDYLLLTDADCRPESTHWIAEMIQGFHLPSTGVVLGYGAYFYEPGLLNRLIRYDTLFNGLHYLGAALCGHPYMGVGRNLAYKKSLFFATGGFTKYMSSSAGDDDLLVNHIAKKNNTQVILTRDSLTWSVPKTNFNEWWQQKRRHLSVSPQYRLGTRLRLMCEPMSRGGFYVLLLLSALLNSSPLLWMMAGVLFVLRWIMQMCIINVSAKNLGEHGFGIGIVGLDIILPLISLYMLITNAIRKPSRW